MISGLLEHGRWNKVTLVNGDARDSVRKLPEQYFDAVFMDGFSPDVNPELWTYDFIRQLRRVLKPDGVIVTYSSAYPLRGAFLRLGFKVRETAAFGRRRGGTAASLRGSDALSEKERNIILKSTAGIPYRDPGLGNTPERILRARERLVKRLRARGVPKWFKG
jgi:SAM-dependent methyltransferase